MKVTNHLICLDIESTGVWVEKDKIIEIALVRFSPDQKKESFYSRVNPGIPIPEAVVRLTGISDQAVKAAPAFSEIAKAVYDFIGAADFGGFNLERFDLPLLTREFLETGIVFDWKKRKVYDAQKVFHLNEKRDLSAAYKFYCDKDLVGAHSALADSEAVLDILEKQVERYGEGQEDLSALDKFEYSSHSDAYDTERKFCWWNGKLFLMFGKHARSIPLEELVKSDPNYLRWILKADFSDSVKKIISDALKGIIPKKETSNQ